MAARSPSALAAAALAAAAAGWAGCAAGETKTVTVSGSQTTRPPAGQAASSTTATAPGPPAVLASRRALLNEVPARLQITELSRSGRIVALTVTITNLSRGDDSLYVQEELGDGVSEDGNEGEAFDGPSLVDTKNARRYLIARDASGACVCDSNLGLATEAEAGQSLSLSATFGAPPEDVGAVNVHIPRFGTFRDVPIS